MKYNSMNYCVHPGIGNDRQDEVYKWCEKIWGDFRDNGIWRPTSNYDRDQSIGTFDIYFKDKKDVGLFLLAWGGSIVEKSIFDSLFEEIENE